MTFTHWGLKGFKIFFDAALNEALESQKAQFNEIQHDAQAWSDDQKEDEDGFLSGFRDEAVYIQC